MRTTLLKLMGYTVVCSALAVSCSVDERYSSDNLKDINTDITLFENGLEIPLMQSTAQFRVDTILKKTGIDTTEFGKFLKVDQAGNYYIEFADEVNLDETIKSIGLEKVASVDKVSYNQDFDFKINSVDASNVKVDAMDFGQTINFADYSFAITADPVAKDQSIVTKSQLNTAGTAAVALGQSEVSFDLADQSIEIDDASIAAVTLPSAIKKINSISLGSNAKIHVKVSVPGCILTAGTITPNIKVDLSDIFTFGGSGVLDLSSLALSAANGYQTEKDFAITGVNAAKIAQTKTVKMNGTYAITGGKTSAAVAAAATSDLMLHLEVEFQNLEVADYSADVVGETFDVSVAEKSIEINAGAEVADYGTFTVTPKGSPALTLSLNLPEDLSGLNLSAGNGVFVQLPDIIKFKNVPQELNYNAANNTIVISEIKKATYSLPIDNMVITPDKDGKVVSKYSISGSIALLSGTVTKAAVGKISGKSAGVVAAVPQIEVATIALDELSFDVNENQEVAFIKEGALPEMIKSVDQIVLDNVAATLTLNLTGLPDLNGGSYNVDAVAELPSFVTPNKIEIKGVIENGKAFTKKIDVTGLDFANVDVTKEIKGNVKVSGKIFATKPSIAIEDLKGTIKGTVNATVTGPNDKIGIKSVSAHIGYQIDTTLEGTSLTLPDFLRDVNFDLPKAKIIADITSNIGIPLSAKINVCGTENTLSFPYAVSPAKVETAHNEIEVDINEILKAERIDLGLSATVDETKACYVEPAAEYTAKISYNVSAPLQIGSGFSYVYSDTLAIGSNASAVSEVLSKTAIALKGVIENTLPFSVSVKADLLAYDEATDSYAELPLEVPAETGLVKAGDKSNFQIELNAKSGVDYSKLSHIRLSVDLSSNGASLKAGDYVQVTNIVAKLPEGVTIDPKNLNL